MASLGEDGGCRRTACRQSGTVACAVIGMLNSCGHRCPPYGDRRRLRWRSLAPLGSSSRESVAYPVGWAFVPTRTMRTDNRAGNSPRTHALLPANNPHHTQLLQTARSSLIIRLPGRLVQLVRILGRHPRGRRFESCTAHQRHFKHARNPSRFCREKAHRCLFCAGQLDQIPSSPRYCEKCATGVTYLRLSCCVKPFCALY